jgi:hypothetical protein
MRLIFTCCILLFSANVLKAQSVNSNPNSLEQKQNSENPSRKDSNNDTIRRITHFSTQDSLRLLRYKKITRNVEVNQSEEINSGKKENQTQPKKVKVTGTSPAPSENDYINVPELDVLITHYWENQRNIKLAKSMNDLKSLDELELKSNSIKSQYVSVYRSVDSNILNPEYSKLYVDFEKDILTNK